MSEKEMNSFRFNSGNEPSEEMLVQLMKEVAQKARETNKIAEEKHIHEMHLNFARKKAKWNERINSVLNG